MNCHFDVSESPMVQEGEEAKSAIDFRRNCFWKLFFIILSSTATFLRWIFHGVFNFSSMAIRGNYFHGANSWATWQNEFIEITQKNVSVIIVNAGHWSVDDVISIFLETNRFRSLSFVMNVAWQAWNALMEFFLYVGGLKGNEIAWSLTWRMLKVFEGCIFRSWLENLHENQEEIEFRIGWSF